MICSARSWTKTGRPVASTTKSAEASLPAGARPMEGTSARPEAVVSTEPATWLEIDDGSITGGQAFLERRLSVIGNLDLAVRMQTLFRPFRRRRAAADLDQIEVDAGGVRISTYVLG